MTQQFSGLIIDGPRMGNNLTAAYHRTSFLIQPQAYAVGPNKQVRLPEARTVVYEFSGGVWACGEYLRAWDDWLPDPGQPPRTGTGRSSRGHVS